MLDQVNPFDDHFVKFKDQIFTLFIMMWGNSGIKLYVFLGMNLLHLSFFSDENIVFLFT